MPQAARRRRGETYRGNLLSWDRCCILEFFYTLDKTEKNIRKAREGGNKNGLSARRSVISYSNGSGRIYQPLLQLSDTERTKVSVNSTTREIM